MPCLFAIDFDGLGGALDNLVTLRHCFMLCALSASVSCLVTIAMVTRRVTWRSD